MVMVTIGIVVAAAVSCGRSAGRGGADLRKRFLRGVLLVLLVLVQKYGKTLLLPLLVVSQFSYFLATSAAATAAAVDAVVTVRCMMKDVMPSSSCSSA